MISKGLLVAVVALGAESITQEERELCHTGVRNEHGRQCHAYASPPLEESRPGKPVNPAWGALDPSCKTVKWNESSADNNWGSCVNITTGVDDVDKATYRFISSNSVPPYYFNPYCPFGLAATCSKTTTVKYCGGYCIDGEPCPFKTLKCGLTQGPGFTALGDVWAPSIQHTKIPTVGNPTRADRPGDMYENIDQGYKTCQAGTGVHLNGNSIQGPNDAGAINVDVAGFMLMCGGHVTPPVSVKAPPMYHYHKAPDCTPEFKAHAIPVDHNGTAKRHGLLFGYMLDGFAIYGYEDLGGLAPVVDECGGHFGATDDDKLDEIVYHYHATTYSPYHNACQGPALSKCHKTQHGANFCGEGCGADVCAQPGTKMADLQSYVSKWNTTWLEKYSTNIGSMRRAHPDFVV